ncbi:hypothetical protein BGZ73_001780 [Actinomortierella ambigua]|nr:hypothetical protein BGZ73_001780 [Actinomortierella ambigua]
MSDEEITEAIRAISREYTGVVPQGWVDPPMGDDDEDAAKDSLLAPPPRSSSLAPVSD